MAETRSDRTRRYIGAGIRLALATATVLCRAGQTRSEDLIVELKKLPYKITYETHRDDNWELFMADADGANPVNLTRTTSVNEIYPHVSADGMWNKEPDWVPVKGNAP